jgi:hypothetical protein
MSGDVGNRISGGIFLSPVIQGRDITVTLPSGITLARSGLPPASPSFSGRGAELRTLLSALSPDAGAGQPGTSHPGTSQSLPPADVLAVCGMAGVGKTELALQAAHAALASGWFPGGALFAEMPGHDHGGGPGVDDVLAGLLRALGVPPRQVPAGAPDRARLYGLILSAFARRGRRVLVLIDGAAAGESAGPLLPAGGSHRVVLTARDPVPIPGSSLLRLNVLTRDDSVDLLGSVLDLAHPGDTRVRDDPGSAARIADLCDGLPLALRIAGALLAEDPALPLAAMAANLRSEQTRLDELSYPGGSVRESFDRSYRHLDRQAARLLRLLTVSPGPDFSAAAAAAIAGLDPAATRLALAALGHLVDHVPGTDRWRLLSLVRLYAGQHGLRHADEDGRAQAFSRLLEHHLSATRAGPGRPGSS